MSEVFTAVQGYRTVACHVPVFEKGEFKGTLAVLFPFHLLAEEFIKNITIGQDGYAWVISQKGVVLYSPVPGSIGKTVFEIFRNSPSAISMTQEMISGKEGIARYTFNQTQGDGTQRTVKQGVYYPIHLGNTIWSIAIATPEKEILSTMTGFRNKLLLVALLFIIAASLYSFYILQARGLLKEEQKRRQTEAALLESETKYRTILDDIEDGYFEVDIRGNLTFFNNAMCTILGYSRAELLGKNNREFMDTETAAKVYQAFNFDLIISDMTMPRLNGLQLAEQSLAIRPGMPLIICTGFSDLITKEKIHTFGIRKVVMKPVFLRDLAFSVRMALDNPA